MTVTLAETNKTTVLTLTNNAVYLHYGAISTMRRRACTDTYAHGRMKYDYFVELSSESVWSMRAPLDNQLYAMDYEDQMNPYPRSGWAGGTACSFDCQTIMPGMLFPRLALQTQLRQALAEWSTCLLDTLGMQVGCCKNAN